MDNGQDGSPPPTRDGRGNPRRVIGIRRINYSGTGLPPVETVSSPEDTHSGGASASEPLPEKQGESPEPPSSPELPALNQQEIQAFYRESLLAMKAAESARKPGTATTPDNELVFYESMSLRSIVSEDLKCEDARATTQTSGVHSSPATTPTSSTSITHGTTQVADAQTSRATMPAVDDSVSRAPEADDSVSRAPAADDSVSRAPTPAADAQTSRVTIPAVDGSVSHAPAADDSVSRAQAADDSVSRAPAADGNVSRAPTPATDAQNSRATTPAGDDNKSQESENEGKGSVDVD
ncbi:mucin-1-like [Haliotis asinina]|uniref:mucin-1-like n=1 Tax=Haliotis asinina TaxID=109174 RepID=UPI003531F42F